MKDLVSNDQAVAGSEAFRYPSGKVQPLFDQDLGIAAEGLGFLQLFTNVGTILVRAVIHLCIKVVQVLRGIRGIASQGFQDLVLTECMGVSTLLGVWTGFVGFLCAEFRAWWTGKPAV